MEGVGTFMVTSTGVYSSYGKTMMSLSEDMPPVTPVPPVLAQAMVGAVALMCFILWPGLSFLGLGRADIS